jgi:23S rRNA (uracil1939-C5)-methyltransferase
MAAFRKKSVSRQFAISRLGHKGDGIAETPEGNAHIAFALPGEIVTAEERDGYFEVTGLLTRSNERAAPICRHFGDCGGCQLQHLLHDAYLAWKRQRVADALAREGIDAELGPIRHFPFASRRRAVFSAIRAGKEIRLGFAQRRTHRIVDLQECPVLEPELSTRLGSLRELAAILAPRRGIMKIAALACDNGLDIAAANGAPVAEATRQRAVAWALAAKVLRLSINGETVIETERPWLQAGLAHVTPPAEGFVQAVAEAEGAMTDLAVSHLAGARKVIDLFSGYGAFALRLAAHAQIHAVEKDGAALLALDQAWRQAGGALKAVSTERRDLYRAPVSVAELKTFDAAVFDPPRAGAEAQAHELAKSSVKRIAAVSCNPATLARDLRILIDGGYRVIGVTPIDQFVFSPHVEAVALLER